MTDLGSLPGYGVSQAEGISDNGSVVVGQNFASNNFYRAFRWTGGVMTDLGTLSGHVSSAAEGVSGNGAVVVGYAKKSADKHQRRLPLGERVDDESGHAERRSRLGGH